MGWVELLKVIPADGGFTGVVVVILIFLTFMMKHLGVVKEMQESYGDKMDAVTGKMDTVINNVTDKFQRQITDVSDKFQAQITTLSEQTSRNQEAHQAQVNGIVDKYIEVVTDNSKALTNLEVAFRELQVRKD